MKSSLPSFRRDFLAAAGGGLGSLALASLLAEKTSAACHYPAKAKRVIQIFCAGGLSHIDTYDYKPELERRGAILDTGAAALLKDLKARGMLEETLVIGTSEFGRQPAAQGKQARGRDHNGGGFTAWMAGGGIKPGMAYGATDELGFQAVDKIVHSYELHATALHLLGLDHENLTWYHNGLEQRLTGFEGKGVIHELLA